MIGKPGMQLKDGAVFLFPDGRTFRAILEAARPDLNPAWTFVPSELEQIFPKSWREALSKLLFLLDDGKIISINFDTMPKAIGTGWTIADLRLAI